MAVVSSGDPGVFAMAAAVFEAVDGGEPAWRTLDIRVEPGVTAMLAAAALAGAPLGADFCAISISDNLKSWSTIERRLEAAARGDFVIALYNPASRARPDGLQRALAHLRQWKADDTIVLFVRAAGTPGRDGERDPTRRSWLAYRRHAHAGAGRIEQHPLDRARRSDALGLHAALGGRAAMMQETSQRMASSTLTTVPPSGSGARSTITTRKPSWRAAAILA